MTANKISRRKFITTAGGVTFAIASYPLFSRVLTDEEKKSIKENNKSQITAWVHLDNTGKITIYNPAAEMGQGSMTALAVLIAEEMDADWSDVNIEYSPIEPSIYGRGWGRGRSRGGTMLTVGSATVRGYYDTMRHAGAQVRYVLVNSVAKKWNVPGSELKTEPSVIIHPSTGRKISFGKVVDFVSIPETIPDIPESEMKQPDQFRLIGKNIPRYDIPSKINGSASYAMDVRLPGMVYAVMSRSPVNGSQPTLTNESEIKSIDGVIGTLTLKHGVAVVADSIGLALETKKKLAIAWSNAKAETYTSANAYAEYERIAGDDNQNWNRLEDKGDVDAAFKKASKTYTFDYKNNFVYHAQMEPLNAVVSISEDGQSAEVWAGTQGADGARAAAASALGMDVSKVTLHPQYLGGGFGRRSMSDYIVEAAEIAKAMRRPVKLIWTREDDVQYGAFRPISLQRMQAAVDNNGNITAWRHRIVGTGDGLMSSGAKTEFYTFPNQRIEHKSVDHGVRTKHWRAVGHGPNKFAIESFIDEIAADQKVDTLEIRKRLMKDHPRAIKVLETAAKMAKWGEKSAPGRAKGIGFGERSDSLVAGVCEISLDKEEGKIKIHNVWAALDAGTVVQPDNAIAQMEGAIVFGISSTLMESISFVNGKVQESNFHDYPILRIADAPENIEIEIIQSNEPPAGIGEAGLPWVGGAIASAFATLSGKRLRHMPFTPERVKEALQS